MVNNELNNDTSLTFIDKYKSINPFDPMIIKPFSIITGLNGSGKTHLLEAIKNGQIKTQFDTKEIQYYSFATMVPNDAGVTNSQDINSANSQMVNWIRQVERQCDDILNRVLIKYNLNAIANKWELLNVPDNKLGEIDGIINIALRDELSHLQNRFAGQLASLHNHQQEWGLSLSYLQRKTERHCLAGLTGHEIYSLPYGWRGTNIFQHSFAQIFYAYFEKIRTNRYTKLDIDDGIDVKDYLTDDQFHTVHGDPPWIFVNYLLEQAKLPFRISYPDNAQITEFTPLLIDQQTGDNYPFSSLSSGEKVLMSFAICLYHSKDTRQDVPKPKLLLLDEIDASLHPLMCRQLIDVITGSIVADHGVNVIMTTHSPSTIAMCPEENIYLMVRGTGLQQTSKNIALSTLTAGVPTLSINYDGRRQVFTEDKNDADRYDKLYQIHKHNLPSERSLDFIPVANSKIEVSGRSQVQSVVRNLTKAGNTSVFGIIDWDNTSISKGNIFVVSEGMHYTTENIFLDPVIIAAAILRETKGGAINLNLPKKTS